MRTCTRSRSGNAITGAWAHTGSMRTEAIVGLTMATAWSRAAHLADRTPASRNRYVDFLRAASMLVVTLLLSRPNCCIVRHESEPKGTAGGQRSLRHSPSGDSGIHSLGYEPGAQSCKFGVADRSCLFKAFELFDFICGAKANHTPKLITRLLSLLHIALCHASSLKDQIGKDCNV